MKRNLLLALAMVLLALAGPVACKKKDNAAAVAEQAQAQLIGSWIIDSEATIANMPAEEREMAQMFINMMRLGMVFSDAGTLDMHVSMLGTKETQSSKYQFVSATAEEVRFNVTPNDPNPETGETETMLMVARFQGTDRVAITPASEEDPNGTSNSDTIVLRRVAAADFETEMNAGGNGAGLEQILGLPEGVTIEDLNGAAEGAEAPAEGAEAPAEAPAAE